MSYVKKSIKLISIIFLITFIVFINVKFLINLKPLQSYFINKISETIYENYNTKVDVSQIDITLNSVQIKGIEIKNLHDFTEKIKIKKIDFHFYNFIFLDFYNLNYISVYEPEIILNNKKKTLIKQNLKAKNNSLDISLKRKLLINKLSIHNAKVFFNDEKIKNFNCEVRNLQLSNENILLKKLTSNFIYDSTKYNINSDININKLIELSNTKISSGLISIEAKKILYDVDNTKENIKYFYSDINNLIISKTFQEKFFNQIFFSTATSKLKVLIKDNNFDIKDFTLKLDSGKVLGSLNFIYNNNTIKINNSSLKGNYKTNKYNKFFFNIKTKKDSLLLSISDKLNNNINISTKNKTIVLNEKNNNMFNFKYNVFGKKIDTYNKEINSIIGKGNFRLKLNKVLTLEKFNFNIKETEVKNIKYKYISFSLEKNKDKLYLYDIKYLNNKINGNICVDDIIFINARLYLSKFNIDKKHFSTKSDLSISTQSNIKILYSKKNKKIELESKYFNFNNETNKKIRFNNLILKLAKDKNKLLVDFKSGDEYVYFSNEKEINVNLLLEDFITSFLENKNVNKSIINRTAKINIGKNISKTLEILYPKLILKSDVNLSYYQSISSKKIEQSLFIKSDSLIYDGIKVENFFIDLKQKDKNYSVESSINNITNSKGKVLVNKMKLLGKGFEKYKNFILEVDTAKLAYGISNLKSNISINKEKNKIEVNLKTKSLGFNAKKWNFSINSIFDNKNKLFTKFFLDVDSKEQKLKLEYKKNQTKNDIIVKVNNFNLSILNPVLKKFNTNIKGKIDGKINFDKGENNSGLIIKGLKFNNLELGSLVIKTKKKDDYKINLSAKLYDDKNAINFDGFYNFKKNKFYIVGNLLELEAKFLNPYFNDIISINKGTLDGNVKLKLEKNKLSYNGNVRSKKGLDIYVKDLNTSYLIKSKTDVKIKKSNINFGSFYLYEKEKNKGTLKGDIFFIKKDFNLNLDIDFKNLKVIDNFESDYNFYGKIISSGNFKLFSSNKKTDINITSKIEESSEFILNLSNTSFSQKSKINFKKEKKTNIFNKFIFDANLKIDIPQEVKTTVLFYKGTGDFIEGFSDGNIEVKYNNNSDTKMFGTLNINRGKYFFKLNGLVDKVFNIKSGSNITWDGFAGDGISNIKSVHTMKTSLEPLNLNTADSLKVVDVNCNLDLEGRLSNPDIKFSYDVNDISEDTKPFVSSIAKTKEEVNTNFLYLVLFNSFKPNNSSRNDNSTTSGSLSGSYKLLLNQLNNVLYKSGLGLKFGFDYKIEDQNYKDRFMFELSKELFKNRVYIETKVGVGGENKTEIVDQKNRVDSDVNLKIKANKKGNINFTIYNKSSNNNINDPENSSNDDYEQGVGISIKNDFDKIGDIFRKKDSMKKNEKKKKK